MSAAPAVIVAPTDAQLRTIAAMIIEAILRRQYDPAFYAVTAPTYYGLDADDSDVPF